MLLLFSCIHSLLWVLLRRNLHWKFSHHFARTAGHELIFSGYTAVAVRLHSFKGLPPLQSILKSMVWRTKISKYRTGWANYQQKQVIFALLCDRASWTKPSLNYGIKYSYEYPVRLLQIFFQTLVSEDSSFLPLVNLTAEFINEYDYSYGNHDS